MITYQGVLNLDMVHAALWALPFLVLGLIAGSRQFIGTTPQAFRRFTLGLLIALSALVFAKAGGIV